MIGVNVNVLLGGEMGSDKKLKNSLKEYFEDRFKRESRGELEVVIEGSTIQISAEALFDMTAKTEKINAIIERALLEVTRGYSYTISTNLQRDGLDPDGRFPRLLGGIPLVGEWLRGSLVENQRDFEVKISPN